MTRRHFDRWYCEICGTVGAEEYFLVPKTRRCVCPNCESEDVFPDYELSCPFCGSATSEDCLFRFRKNWGAPIDSESGEIIAQAEVLEVDAEYTESSYGEGKTCPICERGKFRKCASRKINWPPKMGRRSAKGENNQ